MCTLVLAHAIRAGPHWLLHKFFCRAPSLLTGIEILPSRAFDISCLPRLILAFSSGSILHKSFTTIFILAIGALESTSFPSHPFYLELSSMGFYMVNPARVFLALSLSRGMWIVW